MRYTLLIALLGLGYSLKAQLTLKLQDEETGDPVVAGKIKLDNAGKQYCYLTDHNGAVTVEQGVNDKTTYQMYALGYDTLRGTLGQIDGAGKDVLFFQLKSNRIFDAVLITAQYQPVLVNNAVNKATIISEEQIKQSGSVNLRDILTYQTNIRIAQDNVLGSAVSLGGLSGENVKILIDGIPIIGRQNGNIDISQVNLANVERIEIIEGPLSVNYGTNALAGTLNLITKKEPEKSIAVTLNPYYESIGNYNLTGSVGVKKKGHSLNVSGGRNFFDGWSASDEFFEFPESRPADTNRFKTWKPKEQYFFDARYTGQYKDWSVSPYVRYFDEMITNRGYPLAPYQEVGIDDYYHTMRKDIGAGLNRNGKKSTFKNLLAYNRFVRHKNTYVKDLTTLDQSLSEAEGAQDTALFSLINLRSNYVHHFGDRFSLEGGLDLNYETAYGRRIKGLEQDQGDYAAFLTSEWEVMKNLKLKPGIRYAYNTAYESPVIPSFNVLWKVKDFRIRGSFARGFRAPTLKELYFDFVDINHNIQGNPDLQSESSYNYSGGISWVKSIKNRYLGQVNYSVFYNDIDHLITLGGLPDGSFTYINLGTFKSIGNQLKISAKAKRLNMSVSSSWIGRYNRLSEDVASVDKYTYSPEAGLSFSYDIIEDFLKINAFGKYNGKLQRYTLVNDVVTENIQDGYTIVDLSISTNLLNKKLQITAGGKNLLNVKEVNVVGTSGGAHSGSGNFNAGRGASVFVSASYTFNANFNEK